MQKPSLGRVVLTKVDPTMNNGSDTAPAVITRVWSDTAVNVRVLLDAFTMPLHLTSVQLVETLDELAAVTGHAACWPPRV